MNIDSFYPAGVCGSESAISGFRVLWLRLKSLDDPEEVIYNVGGREIFLTTSEGYPV